MQKELKIATEVSAKSLKVNIMLTALKLITGLEGNSEAMISDAIHSATDVISTIIVMIGLKVSSKKEDKNHPYGHERLESAAAIILSMMLLMTGLVIGKESMEKMLMPEIEKQEAPGIMAEAGAIVSIIVKEIMYCYTRHYGKKIKSEALMADAWHHHSDALSSVGALLGIIGARMGLAIMDPVAGILICLFIIKAGIDILKEAIEKMVDHTGDIAFENALREKIKSYSEVHSIDVLKTREFGNRLYVELEISVNGELPLKDAHKIAEKLHDDIEKTFPQVKHIMIHLNPC